MTATARIDTAEVERSLRFVVEPGATFEIRAIDQRDYTLSGYFRDPAVAAREIAKSCSNAKGVYVTLNPLKPALHSRCADRIVSQTKKGGTTPDTHVVRRTRIRFDFDTAPVAGVSTTDDEHKAAIFAAWSAGCEMTASGWPDPILEDSGNGSGLIYEIDLPCEDGGLVKQSLEAGQARWGRTDGDITIKIDGTMFNPARITKVHGTVARKGDNTTDRPHRQARIIYAPDNLEPVTKAQLEAFVNAKTKTEPPKSEPKTKTDRWDVEAWLDKHGIEHEPKFTDSDGRTVWVLKVCQFNADHARGEAHVHQERSGKIGAACKHDSCKWTWRDLRVKYEPNAYSYENEEPRESRQAANTNTADIPPEPLRRKMPAAVPYPVEALGGILGDAARALNKTVQAPIALCGQSVLGAATLAVQPHADIMIDGRRFPTSLLLMTVAESGERKSATDNIALSSARKIERARILEYRAKLKQYEFEKQAHEAATSKAKKNKTELVDITEAMRECGPPPESPPSPIRLATDPTIEGLQKLFLSGALSLGLFTDEAAAFFGSWSMSAENKQRTIAQISKLWDDGTSDRIRSGEGAHKIFGVRLAAHWMMQPVIAEKVLGDPEMQGQGLLARCLLAAPDTTAGTRKHNGKNPWDEPAIIKYAERMNELTVLEPAVRDDHPGELDPRVLKVGRAAGQWRTFYDWIEERMAPNKPFAQIRPYASKAADISLRIAGVLTIVEKPDATELSVRAMDGAIKIMTWHLAEAMRLVVGAAIPEKVKRAEAVQRWCWQRGTLEIDSRTILQYGPNSVRDKDALMEAMGVLVSHGWCVPIAEVDGKPVRSGWRLRPDPVATSNPPTVENHDAA